nr:hypothetical protein [Tanacetum cinerariifolium]
MEIECAKVRGDLLSYKMEYEMSSDKNTHTINNLNQTVSELKEKLFAHQDTISILKQQKDAQIKLYKTREDKDIEKVIDLENKVKVLDNIVYKTGQSVQTMNMLNNKCRTSFVKPEYLKKANPRLNQCKVTNHQVNIQFLLQIQPEWQRFVTLVKQSQELKNVSYHKLFDILKQHQHENSSIKTQQAATKNRGKAIVNSPQPIYDQEPSMVDDDDETSKDKEIDKLMALISLSFKKIYKPTNNNLQTSSNTSRINQDNSPWIHKNTGYESQRSGNVAGARETVDLKRAKDAAYHREKMLLCKQEEAIIQLNAEQADWKDDTDDESDDQELEAHYMYMAKIQQVSSDAVDSGHIFDKEPEQKIDQNDEDADLAKERELLASLIEKLKCEIDETKNRNTLLETSNKVLVEKLKSEIEDFKNKNKSLKEANNKLSEENDLLYTDFKKSKAELKRRDSIEYASEMELECAKVRVIRLEKESRSKLSDLIRPFDYAKLNNLYDLFVPQREKSSEQQFFSERSRISHINVQKEKGKESFLKQTTFLEKRMDESIS